MFKLTKISIEEGKSSMVGEGYSSILPDLSILALGETAKRNADLEDVRPGYQVYLSDSSRFNGRFHRTSPIEEIVSRGFNKVVFKTQTSLYELEEFNE